MARAHRQAFGAAIGNAVAVVATGHEVVRNRDTHYPFRPDSDFWYLTGLREPDAIAVLRPQGASERYVLFVQPRDPAMETWFGRRTGIEGAREVYGADAAYPISQIDEHLPRLLRGHDRLYYETGKDPDFDRKLLGWLKDLHVRTRDGVRVPAEVVRTGAVLHEQRLRKSPEELDLMRRAAAITANAHAAAMSTLGAGVGEWEIQAVVDGTFRREGGWGPAYPSICAGGENATILHYTVNDRRVGADELLLLDAGCELDGYASDVTRCFPASGRFTDAQRELYDVVLAAQVTGCEHVRPGHSFASVHEVTTRRLVEGMVAVELLAGDIDELIASDAHKRWYMHRTGHWLGLDVHDVGSYVNGEGNSRALEPGMVLTVEPGIYVSADDERAPERFRGIGIRIEDDVLVTPAGNEVLTSAIPKTAEAVEAAC